MAQKYFRYLFVFIVLCPGLALSQSRTIYKGTVRAAENNVVLPNVICEALDANNKVLFYFNSRKDGTFALEVNGKAASLRFRLLGYDKQEVLTGNIVDQENITVSMTQNVVDIPEIHVKAPPITKSKDTIRYNVNSFKTQDDKYIVDLLKKLPGIRVEENGSISYQGESINSFYIEGKDLLGGQYTMVSNNLDVNAVSNVEIWENNQPIKALQGIEHSKKAAINIRLNDSHKVKPFGEAEMGAGGTPFIYSGKAIATLLTPKVQNFSIAKASNTLGSLITELDEKIDLSNKETYVPALQNTLFPPQPKYIPIATPRHLFNDTYIGSTNTLFSLSEFEEVKLNISHGKEITSQNYFLRNTLAAESGNITFNEDSELKNNTSKTTLDLLYKNNNPNKFVNNTFSFLHTGNRTSSYISNEDRVLVVKNKSNPIKFQNIFQGVWKMKNKNLLQTYSLIRYGENLEFMGNTYEYPSRLHTSDFINENNFTEELLTKNGLKYAFGRGRNMFDLEASLLYTTRKFNLTVDGETLLREIEDEQDIRTDTRNHISNLQGIFTAKYTNRSRSGNRITSLSLHLLYNKYTYSSDNAAKKNQIGLFLKPYLSNTIKFSQRFDLHTTANYDVRFGDEISLFNAPFLQSYRSIYLPDNTLNISKSFTFANRIRYSNISRLLFANFYVLYRNNRDNFANSMYNTANWSYITTQRTPTKGEMLNILLDASHTIAPLQLDLKLSPSFNIYKSQFIQQRIFLNNQNIVSSIKAEAFLKSIKNMNVHYAAKFSNMNNSSELTRRTSINTFNQHLNIHYFPSDKLTLSAKNELMALNNFNRENAKFYFLDAELIYQKNKFVYAITGFNLFDSNVFTNSYISTVNTFYQEIPLRNRRVMVSVKFKY